MKRFSKQFLLAAMIMLGAFLCVQSASAKTQTGWQTIDGYTYYYKANGTVKTGWLKVNNKYYYLRKKAEGDKPKGSVVTGFYEMNGATYYFTSKGIRKTGWWKIKGNLYYFSTTSPTGVMYTGRQKIGDYYYYFSTDGKLQTGWVKVNNKKYFYKKNGSAGTLGSGFTGWHKIGSYYYYFNKNGVLQTSKWISSKYYVDAKGRRLVSTITPDGYIVNSNGVKTGLASGWIELDGEYYYYKSGTKITGWLKLSGNYYYLDSDGVRQTGWLTLNGKTYYLNSSGARQTGWVTIDSKRYYFNSSGVMQTSTTVDGVEIDENGVAVSARVLLVAGHGQGDVGATATISGTTYYEYKLTREFSALIYNELTSSGKDVVVTMYDQNYDLYKVMAGKATGPSVTWTDYDYVLEVHFNAGISDQSGNGSYTGTAMLVHTSKSDTSIDRAIAKAVKDTGFSYWGSSTGIVRRSDLLNMNLCYRAGVSYGLLETAFIDDKDDMNYYQKNKDEMAEAVASALLSSLGL